MSYARVERSPRRPNSPLYSPSYAGSASGSSHGSMAKPSVEGGANVPFLAATSQSDHSVGARNAAQLGAGTVGGREFGPYSPLNRRQNAGSYEDDRRSMDSSAERFGSTLGPGAGAGAGAGAGYGVPGGSAAVDMRGPEADDFLHDSKGVDGHSNQISARGVLNVLTLMILVLALLMLFAGYPILYHLLRNNEGTKGGFNLGGTNGSGQVASFPGLRGLIDTDTPDNAKTWTSPANGQSYNLQFSDEFEKEGRTFWPGDDQFFEAVDIWYGVTGDYEWYSPENVNTTGGALVLTMTDIPTHDLNFQSGMVQSWNKLCFQGGYIEFSIIQPGSETTQGYWPGAWTMGNLGRPGYPGSTDGMWPYSYQSCDTGILANQTFINGTGPDGAIDSDAQYASNGKISKLPGMRYPSCTCAGEDHPGPKNTLARSAPEMDILEAQIQSTGGEKHSYASQSLQTGPFDPDYFPLNDTFQITGAQTKVNTYTGGPYQEAVSAVSQVPARGFMDVDMPDAEKWVTYGLEYQPDFDFNGNGFITWYVDGKETWTVTSEALAARPSMDIGQRIIPTEPMSIVMNLGISKQFQTVDFDPTTGVNFPAQMKFDYIRIFQKKGQEKMSCDPSDYPTKDFIQRHLNAYQNPNNTVWGDTGNPWPKNQLVDKC